MKFSHLLFCFFIFNLNLSAHSTLFESAIENKPIFDNNCENDTIPPYFVVFPIGALDLSCDELYSEPNFQLGDNCSSPENLEISYEDALFSGSCYGTVERTWTISDESSNAIMFTQYLFLFDDTAPVINGPSNTSVFVVSSSNSIAYEYSYSVTDNCDTQLDGSIIYEVTNLQCDQTNTIQITQSDICDNESNHNFTVDVVCLDPNTCEAHNFENSPTGLFADQNNGINTRLKWNHYSNASSGCILQGGSINSPDPGAGFNQIPGKVLVQGSQINGLPDGYDFTAALSPDSEFELFNINTFPSGNTASLIPGARYKWRVQCGCFIDPDLPIPDRFNGENLHMSPWSEYAVFTNLEGDPLSGLKSGNFPRG